MFVLSLFLYELSKAMLSISMIGLVVSVLLFTKPAELFRSFLSNKALLLLSLGFVVLLLSFINSENISYYFNRLQVKLPLLLLPVAFAGLTFDKRQYQLVFVLYIMLAVIVSGITLVNYSIHYEEINSSYLQAKVMPTILNHVRFSIMVAVACMLSFYLYRSGMVIKYTIERWIYLVIAVLLFVFLHMYSVRSGLVALYGMIGVQLVMYIIATKAYFKVLLFTGGIFGLFALFTQLSPTLQNKWTNTKEDIAVYKGKGYANYNSLTTRLISYEAAISIFKHNIWTGCGLGDVKDETDRYFREHYPEIDIPILPHNQFLFYLAATGLIGLFLFIVTFFFPLFYKGGWKNELLMMFYVTLFLSFQTEPMLETQLGLGYSIGFVLLLMSAKRLLAASEDQAASGI
jgi:O-antigen ligase